jgi:TPR repeat protein
MLTKKNLIHGILLLPVLAAITMIVQSFKTPVQTPVNIDAPFPPSLYQSTPGMKVNPVGAYVDIASALPPQPVSAKPAQQAAHPISVQPHSDVLEEWKKVTETENARHPKGKRILHDQNDFCTSWLIPPQPAIKVPHVWVPDPTWTPYTQEWADVGSMPAELTLGVIYLKGYGVKEDDAEAFKWLRKSAEQDDLYSKAEIGKMYELGEVVKKQSEKAYFLLSIASIKNMWEFYLACRQAEAELPPKKLNEIRNRIKDWAHAQNEKIENPQPLQHVNLPTPSHLLPPPIGPWGVWVAPLDLVRACTLNKAHIMKENFQYLYPDDQVIQRFSKNAEQKCVPAINTLGEMCMAREYGAYNDVAEALKWFRLAADRGDPVAEWHMGEIYSNRYARRIYESETKLTGVPLDYNEARKWFQKSADKNYLPAMISLSFLPDGNPEIKQGNDEHYFQYMLAEKMDTQRLAYSAYIEKITPGQKSDAEKRALKWFSEPAHKGNVTAQHIIGTMYANGEGSQQNWIEAYFWLTLSQRGGFEPIQVDPAYVAEHLTADQIAAIKKRVDEWKTSR